MTYLQAILSGQKKAAQMAKEKGVPYCVVEIDPDGEGEREIRVCRESYTETDEFEAYCGEVIAIVHPSGEVES